MYSLLLKALSSSYMICEYIRIKLRSIFFVIINDLLQIIHYLRNIGYFNEYLFARGCKKAKRVSLLEVHCG